MAGGTQRDRTSRIVLVIDDDVPVLRALRRALRHSEYEVLIASSGREGLDLVNRHGIPDVVVLDLRMPGLDGLQVLRAIRQAHPTLPVIFFSGFLDEKTEELLLANGANVCVPKTETTGLFLEIDRLIHPSIRLTTNVLVADSSYSAAVSIARFLKSVVPGINVAAADSLDQAMKEIERHDYDVVILDWDLRGGGRRLLRWMTNLLPAVPLIVALPQDNDTYFHEAFFGGAFLVMHKPFHSNDFLSGVIRAFRAAPSFADHNSKQQPAGARREKLPNPGGAGNVSLHESLGDEFMSRAFISDSEPSPGSKIFPVLSTSARVRWALTSSVEPDWPEPSQRLESAWETGSHFLAGVVQRDTSFSFFVPLAAGSRHLSTMRTGASLLVNIRFNDRQMSFRIHVYVVGRLTTGDDPGLQVRVFDADRVRFDKILHCARGLPNVYVRRADERFPCFFSVKVKPASAAEFDAVVTNISLGGVRLGVLELWLKEDTEVVLRFEQGHEGKPFSVHGKVVYVESSDWPHAVGVQFLFRSSQEESCIKEMVRLAKARGGIPD